MADFDPTDYDGQNADDPLNEGEDELGKGPQVAWTQERESASYVWGKVRAITIDRLEDCWIYILVGISTTKPRDLGPM